MIDVALDCPHCGSSKVGFRGSNFLVREGNGTTYILLLQCGHCRYGVVAEYQSIGFIEWIRTSGANGFPRLIRVWPEAPAPNVPKYLPDNIRGFYLQGLDSLRRGGYDAAGTMFRKCLDVGLKRIHPEGRGTLQKRIDALPSDLGITPAMKEWAHEIRDLGNDAAHEEEPFSESEAKALHAFAEMFLTYAFTLPGMLAERKNADPPP
jgi:hypothetical protein